MEKVYRFLNKLTGEEFNKAQWNYIIDNVNLGLFYVTDINGEDTSFGRLLFVEPAINKILDLCEDFDEYPAFIDDELKTENQDIQKIWKDYQNKFFEFCKLKDD